MGAREKYGENKRDGEAILEGNRQEAKGKEESGMKEGVGSKFVLEHLGFCLFLTCGGETGNHYI
jgi:hypothetical protein